MEEIKEIDFDPSLLRCSVCEERYNEKKHVPRVLPCLHVTCEKCLHVNVRGRSLECPSCRMYHKIPSGDVRRFPMDNTRRSIREIFRIKNKSHTLTCKNCSDGEKAVYFCKDCTKLLCSRCTDIHLHKRNQATNQHHVVHLQDLRAVRVDFFRRKPTCFSPDHEKYDLTFFCNNPDCQKPICNACAVSNHRADEGHIHCSIKEVYKEKKTFFINSMKTISDQMKEIRKIETDLQDKIDDAKALMKATCREIDTYFDKLIYHLNDNREKLKQQTKNTVKKKTSYQRGILKEMKMKRDERSTLINFVEHMLGKGGETDLLLVSKLLTERTDQLKKQNVWQKSADTLGVSFKHYVTEQEQKDFINNLAGIKSISVSSEDSKITLRNCQIGIKSRVATIVLCDHHGKQQMDYLDDIKVTITDRVGKVVTAEVRGYNNGQNGYGVYVRATKPGIHYLQVNVMGHTITQEKSHYFTAFEDPLPEEHGLKYPESWLHSAKQKLRSVNGTLTNLAKSPDIQNSQKYLNPGEELPDLSPIERRKIPYSGRHNIPRDNIHFEKWEQYRREFDDVNKDPHTNKTANVRRTDVWAYRFVRN